MLVLLSFISKVVFRIGAGIPANRLIILSDLLDVKDFVHLDSLVLNHVYVTEQALVF